MTDPGTALEAGAKVESRSRLRAAVLELHEQHPAGLTDDELARLLPREHAGSVSKRRCDLVRAGALVDTGLRRRTRRGSRAVVWGLAP